MDWQTVIALIGLIFTIEAACVGWLLRHAARLTRVETWGEAMRQRADTFEQRILDSLSRIEAKLDGKADKP